MKVDDYVFTADKNIVCSFKNSLKRSEPIEYNGINGANYVELFALYADEHDKNKLKDIKDFLAYNPHLKAEFDSWQRIELVADKNIKFEEKELLRRRILKFNRFYKVSAAASILLILGAIWSIILHEPKTSVNNGLCLKTNRIEIVDNNKPTKLINSTLLSVVEKQSLASVVNTIDSNVMDVLESKHVDNQISEQLTFASLEKCKMEMIKLKNIDLGDFVNAEMVELEMLSNLQYKHDRQNITANYHFEDKTQKKPKNFVGKLFNGIAQIFKTTDRSEIRYMALRAISQDFEPNNGTHVTSTDGESEGGFYIMGIYIVKKKAE